VIPICKGFVSCFKNNVQVRLVEDRVEIEETENAADVEVRDKQAGIQYVEPVTLLPNNDGKYITITELLLIVISLLNIILN
jgi:organic hydroperoxide reductase OsmC/OhrA